MSKVLVNDTDLGGIASAIRRKNGGSTLYKPSEMAAAVDAIPTGITPTGTKSITENGTYDVTNYASASVNVPNSYSASDEGKVVDNGALVSQTSRSVTQNGTYDTTTNDEVVVNVQGGGGIIESLSVTQNGTYTPPSGVDGYAPVVVNVGGGDDPFVLTDYIESSGTQWINTGYYVQDDSEFEAIANVESYNRYPTIFGVRTSSERGEAVIFAGSDSSYMRYNWDITYSPNQPVLGDGTPFYNKKTIFRLSKQKILVEAENGSVHGIAYSGGSITADYPLYLFSLDQGGADLAICRCNMKLYRFRIRESGVLVHEFLPWIDGNNVVCLKDTVTGNLFYNAGTGVFTYGTDA